MMVKTMMTWISTYLMKKPTKSICNRLPLMLKRKNEEKAKSNEK
jgi:hypothetical protein